jgi:NAD(P)H-dependent FMN reductase
MTTPTATPIPLLVFAGSSRAQSWNRKLAQATADAASTAGAQVTHLELGDFDLPLYNGDLETRGIPHDVIRLKEIFHAHPAWLVVSPEYNGSYTGLLKNTIDWVSRPFAGKVVGMLSASPGALGGLRSLSHLAPLLMNLQCWVSPKQFALSRAAEAFDADGGLTTDASRAGVQAVIDQVLWAAGKFQA